MLVSLPSRPVTFSAVLYAGVAQVYESQSPVRGWSSAYLPEGWYGLLKPGQAVWGAIPDIRQMPSSDYVVTFASGRQLTDPGC